MHDILPVILSGGSGTRLWPLSREAYPKQFLPLAGELTMLQATWQRVAAIAAHGPLVIANEAHRFVAAEQLQQVGAQPQAIILEPLGRNTAPAIAVAALEATGNGADPLLLVLPSDHVIADEAAFRAAVQQAAAAAEAGKLVTFGIVPTGPETGYGYIKAAPGEGARAVERFVEKPDLETATGYVASGQYLWNSGMFLLRASRYLAELARFNPAMLDHSRTAWQRARRDADFTRLDAEAFAAVPSDSIDYAVMEKTSDAVVVALDAGWNDVGSWTALRDVSTQDGDGNAHHGDVISIDSRNSYAYARRMVALVGVDDLVVVETDDAVLVARKDRVQQVKDVVARLKAEQRTQAALHREVHRPWGSYDSIDMAEGFQVKRIKVKPGARLSLQSHTRRAEHWIVVRGTARVTRDNDVFELFANQSTYIPIGAKHRLENPGTEMLELIEVQSGDYLGEDDIVRYEDVYGRS